MFLLAAITTSIFLIDIFRLDMLAKRIFNTNGRVKPFDCHSCLAAWLCGIFYFLPENITYFCFAATLSAIVTPIISNICKRLF